MNLVEAASMEQRQAEVLVPAAGVSAVWLRKHWKENVRLVILLLLSFYNREIVFSNSLDL